MTNTQQIATTILKQIGCQTLWAIAARKKQALKSGVKMTVSGAQFKGTFEIEYDAANDLYNCRTIKMKRSLDKNPIYMELGMKKYNQTPVTVSESKGLFAEDLSSFIDNNIY